MVSRLRFSDYLPFITLAATAAILAVHAVTAYGGFVEDDAFISLRYAKRFLQGHGLTWTDGEPVEGYTNFLWVLLIAAAGGLSGAELVNVARVLGIALTCIGLGAVIAGNAPRRWRAVLPAAAPALALAVSGPVAT